MAEAFKFNARRVTIGDLKALQEATGHDLEDLRTDGEAQITQVEAFDGVARLIVSQRKRFDKSAPENLTQDDIEIGEVIEAFRDLNSPDDVLDQMMDDSSDDDAAASADESDDADPNFSGSAES